MCCPGCQAVARLIVESGLAAYYRHREGAAPTPPELVPALAESSRYDRPELRAELVRAAGGGGSAMTIAVEGLRCSACCWLIESRLSRLPGVSSVRVSLAAERCDVEWSGVEHGPSRFIEEILKLGYRAYPYRPDRRAALRRAEQRRSLVRLGIAGLAAMQVMMFAASLYAGSLQGMAETYRVFLRWVSAAVTLPVVVVSARPFFAGARRDLANRRLGMDVPIAIAVTAAFAASLIATVTGGAEVYYDSVCMFVFFLLVGRHFEARARDRASQAVENALRSPPPVATRIGVGGALDAVALATLVPGDRVLVKAGETFPADGTILEGAGAVDEAMLSGEHWPRDKRVGDRVLGGSQNGDSPFVVEVGAVGEGSTLAAIVRLVEGAGAARPAVAEIADRVAGWFVPTVLACAGAVACWWWPRDPSTAFHAALAVLVVTCPCALSLATPAALAAATGGLLGRGFLIARSHVLESLASATHVVFDKTGTLTQGRLRLGRRQPAGRDGSAEAWLLSAAALESRSEHPIARAFGAAVGSSEMLPAVADARNVAGRGIEGVVEGRRMRIGIPQWVAESWGGAPVVPPDREGWILLGDDAGPLCWFELLDAPRAEAAEVVGALADRGIETWIVSGDREEAVRTVADRLGVAAAVGGASAADKLAHVRRLQKSGAVVVMVGDGVNDAPGLGGAHVSVAMGGGTDLALSRADSVLLREDLRVLVDAVEKARRTRRVIAQNLGWATLYNIVAIPLAAAGWIAPYWAAAGMSASSLLVVGNAMRLARGSAAVRGTARSPVAARGAAELGAMA